MTSGYPFEIGGMPIEAGLETRSEVLLGPDTTLVPNCGRFACSTGVWPEASSSGWMVELCELEGDVVRVLIAEGESE